MIQYCVSVQIGAIEQTRQEDGMVVVVVRIYLAMHTRPERLIKTTRLHRTMGVHRMWDDWNQLLLVASVRPPSLAPSLLSGMFFENNVVPGE